MAVAVDSHAARVCREHRAFRLRSAAQAMTRRHRAAVRSGRLNCRKCARGQRFDFWRCNVVGEPHFHTGHKTEANG